MNKDGWRKVKLGDIMQNISDKKHGELRMLSVVHGTGLMHRDEYFNNAQYNDSKEALDKYKRCIPGDFINDLSTFSQGMEMTDKEGLVSPAYGVLRVNNIEECLPEFLKYVFVRDDFIKSLQPYVKVGARQGKNIAWADMSQVEIDIPPYEQQLQIADALSHLDSLISVKGGGGVTHD